MRQLCLPEMLLGQQWERTKGELRALVKMQGSFQPGENTERWQMLSQRVDYFIQSVEFDGLDQ